MRTTWKIAGFALWLLAATTVLASEQIPWVADYKQACELAADQRRLVLLHFYGDNCPPCLRVEQNVFSQPQVAQAIAKNYIPVKVHVGVMPDLAARYGVNRWPTDVICSAAGQEITRAVSPQSPGEYIAMIDHVAMQAGVGAARQWVPDPAALAANATQQGAAQAQAFASRMGTSAQEYLNQANEAAQGYAGQAATTVQGYAGQAQQQLAQANQQYQQVAEQATAAAGQAQQQLADASQQLQTAGQQFQGVGQQFQAAGQGALANLRSAWQPPGAVAAEAPPAAAPPATTAYMPAPAPQAQSQFQPQPQAQPQPQIGTVPPGGYVVNQAIPGYQPPAQPTSSPPVAAPAPQPAMPPVGPVNGPPSSGPAPQVVAAPTSIPASQAPPSIMDGYCPVTLIEQMKWVKADPRFGVVHRNRTYLFATAAEQQKFLANPDQFAPVLDGCDPVRFAKTRELAPGKRSCGVTYNGKIFLFADEQSLAEFSRTPEAAKGFATTAYQAMLPQQMETTLR
jgi:thiol-disulfide isomerase/thioredoxin